jgi:DNA primase
MNLVKQNIDVRKILDYYSVKNISSYGDEINFSCPFPEHHRGDQRPSSYINSESYKYNCFGCDREGSIVTFVAELEDMELKEAEQFLFSDGFIGEYLEQNSLQEYLLSIVNKKPEQIKTVNENALKLFEVDWDKAWQAYIKMTLPKSLRQLFNRNFKPQTLRGFDIGYDIVSNRITIPCRNISGDIVGFKGRSVNPSQRPKYLNLGDREEKMFYGFGPYKVGNYVWGLDSADENGIIVEGELDAIWLRQNGYYGAVSLGGSNPTKKQISQMGSVFSSAVLLLDPDQAGEKAARNLKDALIKYFPVRIASCFEGKDPQQHNPQQLHKVIHEAKTTLIKEI